MNQSPVSLKEITKNDFTQSLTLPVDFVENIFLLSGNDLLLDQLGNLQAPAEVVNLFHAVCWAVVFCLEASQEGKSIASVPLDEISYFFNGIQAMTDLGHKF